MAFTLARLKTSSCFRPLFTDTNLRTQSTAVPWPAFFSLLSFELQRTTGNGGPVCFHRDQTPWELRPRNLLWQAEKSPPQSEYKLPALTSDCFIYKLHLEACQAMYSVCKYILGHGGGMEYLVTQDMSRLSEHPTHWLTLRHKENWLSKPNIQSSDLTIQSHYTKLTVSLGYLPTSWTSDIFTIPSITIS